MSLIYGTGSFTRFKVEGGISEENREIFQKNISRYAFRNLDENSDEERSTGWVSIMDMFDSAFGDMNYFKEPCIALSWRVDVRSVPSKALRQYSREAEEKIKTSEELEHISKKRRQEIKEAVWIQLLKRAIPRSNIYDMIWNVQTGLVIFAATSTKLCDEFSEFFLKCFGLHLMTVFPHSMASDILKGEEVDPGVLEELEYSVGMEGD
ncbi:MAG: recombination-associated protein RdgC [Desulfatiglandales bacterium]